MEVSSTVGSHSESISPKKRSLEMPIAASSRPRFPKELFVHLEESDGTIDAFWAADETTDSIDDGVKVAIYELKEVKRMRVTRNLE